MALLVCPTAALVDISSVFPFARYAAGPAAGARAHAQDKATAGAGTTALELSAAAARELSIQPPTKPPPPTFKLQNANTGRRVVTGLRGVRRVKGRE